MSDRDKGVRKSGDTSKTVKPVKGSVAGIEDATVRRNSAIGKRNSAVGERNIPGAEGNIPVS